MRFRLAAILTFLAFSACTHSIAAPASIDRVIDEQLREDRVARNPVIIIPGLGGSRLVDYDSGDVVWGTYRGDFADPDTPDGAYLFSLPMREGVPLAKLRDGVVPLGILDRVRFRLFGIPFDAGVYRDFVRVFGMFRDDEDLGRTLAGRRHQPLVVFQFSYDWRRDISENARRLQDFMDEKREALAYEYERRGIGAKDIHFDIIAHSMGSLLTRYYLRYGAAPLPEDGSLPEPTGEGMKHVDAAVLVGPPNAGSLDSFLALTDGYNIASILPSYKAGVIGTLPSGYQLMPRVRHRPVTLPDGTAVDLYDPAVWDRYSWGILAEDQDRYLQWFLPGVTERADRRRIALDHLSKCLARAKQFQAAIDIPIRIPDSLKEKQDRTGFRAILYAGNALPTAARAVVDPATGRVAVTERGPGDGRVLRSSALMDERVGREDFSGGPDAGAGSPIDWTKTIDLASEHMEITSDPAFVDTVFGHLTELRVRRRQAPKH